MFNTYATLFTAWFFCTKYFALEVCAEIIWMINYRPILRVTRVDGRNGLVEILYRNLRSLYRNEWPRILLSGKECLLIFSYDKGVKFVLTMLCIMQKKKTEFVCGSRERKRGKTRMKGGLFSRVLHSHARRSETVKLCRAVGDENVFACTKSNRNK